MKFSVFTFCFLVAASFANADNCVVSPSGSLNVPGKSLPLNWSNRSDLTRAFQDIGYTAGPAKTELAEGEKTAHLALFCDGIREGRKIVFSCAAALIIAESQDGKLVTLNKSNTQAHDGATIEEAMFSATLAATRRIPRCQ